MLCLMELLAREMIKCALSLGKCCYLLIFSEGFYSSKLTNSHNCRYYGLKPDIKVISPWREWDLTSRSTLIKYAESRGIEVPSSKRGEPPFSMDANLLHISYEGSVS